MGGGPVRRKDLLRTGERVNPAWQSSYASLRGPSLATASGLADWGRFDGGRFDGGDPAAPAGLGGREVAQLHLSGLGEVAGSLRGRRRHVEVDGRAEDELPGLGVHSRDDAAHFSKHRHTVLKFDDGLRAKLP